MLTKNRFLLLSITILLFVFLSEKDLLAYDFQSLADNLSESGHRDIRFVRDGKVLKIFYWPIGFRDDYKGFVDIKNQTIKMLPDFRENGIERVDMIQTAYGIPTVTSQISLNYTPEKIHFTKKYYPGRYNSNNYYPSKKFMILFDIPLSMNFGQFYDPLIFKTGIGPRFMYRFSDSILANVEVDFFIHNEYDVHEYYKPGNIGIMLAKTLSDNIISITNLGAFREDIYGFDQELSLSLLNDKISLDFHGGMYGEQTFTKNEFKYKKISHKLALLKMIYSNITYDCRLTLMGGRFLYDDKGFGAEISRVFKEVEIGFTGIKTGGDLVLNLFFSIPLFPQSRISYAKYGVSHEKHFKLKYWYYSNKLGHEPQISTSRNELRGLSTPSHYEFMSRNF